MKKWSRWQDWTNLALGTWLFISPWLFMYSARPAAANAWIVGAGVVAVAAWALARPSSRGAEGTNIALGAWTFLAPWLMGFMADAPDAAWNAWIVGGAVVVFSYAALQQGPRHTTHRHA